MNRILTNKIKNLIYFSLNKYSTSCIYNEEFTVNTFCNLIVKCPFNIKITPLDVLAYPNSDKLILKVFAPSSTSKINIKCNQNNEKFSIVGDSNAEENINCVIEAPVKSDLNIKTSGIASIDIKKINGNLILLETELGDVVSTSCQSSKIKFSTRGGCITTSGTLHAADIELETTKTGHINVNHLQALRANIKTENGDVNVKSSYCDETKFQTDVGKFSLDNIHKKCTILILEEGHLHMTGFDGTLDAFIKGGYIDIQASKLYETSTINIENKGTLLLRLSEWIQENTLITTTCQQLKIDDNIQLMMKNEENCAVLVPKEVNFKSELIIKSLLSNITIQGASWSDMLKLKGIHFSD